MAVEDQTFSCDAEAPGRIPTYPRKNDPHAHDALDKMAEDARKACWAQIADKVSAALTGSAVPAATPASVASEAAPAETPAPAPAAAPVPAADVAPATPTS